MRANTMTEDYKSKLQEISREEIEDLIEELDRMAERFPMVATLLMRLVEAQNIWSEDHLTLHGIVIPQMDFTNTYLFGEGDVKKEDMN